MKYQKILIIIGIIFILLSGGYIGYKQGIYSNLQIRYPQCYSQFVQLYDKYYKCELSGEQKDDCYHAITEKEIIESTSGCGDFVNHSDILKCSTNKEYNTSSMDTIQCIFNKLGYKPYS